MNSDADSEVCSLSRPFLYTIRFDAYDGTADSGLGELQFSGDSRDSRPALTVLISTVVKIDIHGDCPVWQVTAIKEIKSAQWPAPPTSSMWAFRLLGGTGRMAAPPLCLSADRLGGVRRGSWFDS